MDHVSTWRAFGLGRLSMTCRRWAAAVAVCALATTGTLAPGSSASGAVSSSVLCSGYTACSQGQFSTHGYPSHAWTSYWQMYGGDNCTNYVAYAESTFGVPKPSYSLGNADEWVAAAAAHGVLVNHTPTVGAVAVWNGDMGGSGHVAIVEAVGPNASYVDISQQHMIVADGFDWVRIHRDASMNQWQDWPSAFIHFPLGPVAASQSHALSRVTARFQARSANASLTLGALRSPRLRARRAVKR